MVEVLDDRRAINRTIYVLDSLHDALSPQEFGRAMQRVLACVFQAQGFLVVQNAVGVPDFTATGKDAGRALAVEVKTCEGSRVSLTQRDLDGVRVSGQTGVLAVLVFPDRTPRWLLISADTLSARAWLMRHLAAKPQVDVGFGVSDVFYRVVGSLQPEWVRGGPELEQWLDFQLHSFLASAAGRAG